MRVPAIQTSCPLRRQQKGAVLILFAVGALAIIGMAGLALDLGNAYLAKTRLQNALDAAALSGARTLNATFDAQAAVEDARETYAFNMGLGSPQVETSATLLPFVPGSADPRFVRVSVATVPVPVTFSRAVGLESLAVDGSAVAGPIPLNNEFCNAFPVALCGVTGDSDCTDGSCYGIAGGPDSELQLYGNDTSLGPGNYALLEMGCSGANCLRQNLAGGTDFCFSGDGTVPTKPGKATGPTTQGVNTRFGIYKGGMSAAQYPPDAVTANNPALFYNEYQDRLANPDRWDHPEGVPQRRVVALPVIDCSTPINGASDATVLGAACMFLTRPMAQGGDATIYAQLVPTCLATGRAAENPVDEGPQRIILYQDPLDPRA